MKILIFSADRWPEEESIVKFPQNGIFLYLPKEYFPNLHLPPFQTLKKKSFPLPFLLFNLPSLLDQISYPISQGTRARIYARILQVYIYTEEDSPCSPPENIHLVKKIQFPWSSDCSKEIWWWNSIRKTRLVTADDCK